jgi:hypothetical protein
MEISFLWQWKSAMNKYENEIVDDMTWTRWDISWIIKIQSTTKRCIDDTEQ